MVSVVVFEFSVMRCQPLRRALGECYQRNQLVTINKR
ncbi:acetyltransferase [Vibrio cholerae]|nr:acetyltransferase [Vibrio cholerae]